MILDSTLRTLQVVLVSPPATNQLPVVVDWVDNTATTFTPGSTVSNTNGTALVTILAAPAASTQRKVNGITIYNYDTAPVNVRIFYNDNGTSYQLQDLVLQVDDSLGYTDVSGWYTLDGNGNIKGKGTPGTSGINGGQGPVGVILDGDEGPEGFPIPGPMGAVGSIGPAGPAIYLDAEGLEGDMGPPGAVGPQGIQGLTGAQGPSASSGAFLCNDAEASVDVATEATIFAGGSSSLGTLQTANNLSELTATASTARGNISAAASGANNDITSLGALNTVPTIIENDIPKTPNITATASSGILTVTLVAPAKIVGQNAGVPWSATIGANLTIATTTTATSLGATTAQQTRLAVVYSQANSSLGLINLSGGTLLDESNSLTPVVISAGSTSATTLYTASGTTATTYKILGFIDATWTSGTGWATPANIISASAASYTGSGMSSLGYGQTWQTVTRTIGTTYYNTTGRAIKLNVTGSTSPTTGTQTITVNGVVVASQYWSITTGNYPLSMTAVIPPGGSYVVGGPGMNTQVSAELR